MPLIAYVVFHVMKLVHNLQWSRCVQLRVELVATFKGLIS